MTHDGQQWWRFWADLFELHTPRGQGYLPQMCWLIWGSDGAYRPPNPANDNGWPHGV